MRRSLRSPCCLAQSPEPQRQTTTISLVPQSNHNKLRQHNDTTPKQQQSHLLELGLLLGLVGLALLGGPLHLLRGQAHRHQLVCSRGKRVVRKERREESAVGGQSPCSDCLFPIVGAASDSAEGGKAQKEQKMSSEERKIESRPPRHRVSSELNWLFKLSQQRDLGSLQAAKMEPEADVVKYVLPMHCIVCMRRNFSVRRLPRRVLAASYLIVSFVGLADKQRQQMQRPTTEM